MKKKVLIAVGDKSYSNILTETFNKHQDDFYLSSQEVLHRRFLEEILDIEKPDILIIHDYYLGSDFVREEQREDELISFFRKIRVDYDDSVRVVFLCERARGDAFLSNLVSIGVLDIVNSNSFDLDDFIDQLIDKPRFSRVEKFLITSSHGEASIEPEELETSSYEEEDTPDEVIKEKAQQPVIQKVVEKKVVQKVVNKTTIKRDYTFHVHNQVEKVVGVPVKKKLILIGSTMPRSGSTFISHLVARALTQIGISTTYVESPFSKAYTYDRLYGRTHAEDYRSKFYQFSKYIDPKLKSVFDWTKSDVEIICKHPTNEPVYEEEDISFENLIKVLFSSLSTVTVIDVGTDWQYEMFQDVFDIADHVYFVMEPDIPFIQYFEESQKESVEFLRKQLENEKTSIIGNRFDKTILDNELIKYMYEGGIKTTIPNISVSDVFQAQYKGIFLNDLNDYAKRLELPLKPLLEDILPEDFMKKQRKGANILKSLFRKKISIEKTESKGEEMSV
ncbi:hypothetical protein D1B31_17895 [Neobacillus notoginsengisoli]|uniref:Uncharacterized protein n=1 Tax=Neobacillus notoginsengisoli TaxID=1578198 RepID=A0A417YPN5_9BACI|nr:hypothetical protein [Neobacillus notoginsengisoli]RHW35964.1 hypothetical protein D1B31_17895 [Neobacillus notoginsengisoli]